MQAPPNYEKLYLCVQLYYPSPLPPTPIRPRSTARFVSLSFSFVAILPGIEGEEIVVKAWSLNAARDAVLLLVSDAN